ncbi:MAG TPA: LD-carboxypeptidase [Polyangiaceae bacterium]|nr:LD-carboxypeptidase [Polyangiaceae bacterium]
MLLPSAVRPGDPVTVIAPSGPFDVTHFNAGLNRLRQRYTVRMDDGVYACDGFLAGSDERRLSELNGALREENSRAILIARGGYGLSRITPHADFAALRSWPKWIVGFSDATVLHVEASRAGVASIHGPNVTGLGGEDEAQWQAYCAHLEAPTAERTVTSLEVWQSGAAQGNLFGGNLSLLHSAAAAGRLDIPAGALLFIEEIGEAPYRIDRMLTALLQAGVFNDVVGVVLGQFHNCEPGDYGVSAEAVVRERLSSLTVPIVAGLQAGHGSPNLPLTFGIPARITGDSIYFGSRAIQT